MICLAKKDKKFLSLREISERENISFNFLEKIMSKLEKEKLVKSKKGIYGGYTLAKSIGGITVWEILRALEGEIVIVECMGVKSCVREKSCLSRSVWKKLQNSLKKTIDSITLKDLIE